jgi:hypothetical protein
MLANPGATFFAGSIISVCGRLRETGYIGKRDKPIDAGDWVLGYDFRIDRQIVADYLHQFQRVEGEF